MRMARHSNPPLRKGGVEKLSMASFLAPEYPALLMEPLENLANFHSTTVTGRTRKVNAERFAQPRHAAYGQYARPLRPPPG